MSKGSSCRVILSLSILDMSSTSLMSISRCLEEKLIFCRQSSTREASPAEAAAMVVMPMMALRGVRISWLMRERKSLLAELARSAVSMASRNAWRERTSSVRSERTEMIWGASAPSTR